MCMVWCNKFVSERSGWQLQIPWKQYLVECTLDFESMMKGKVLKRRFATFVKKKYC